MCFWHILWKKGGKLLKSAANIVAQNTTKRQDIGSDYRPSLKMD